MKSPVLIVAGLMMVVIGTLHLIAPQMMMETPGVALTSTNHFHIIRAAYGGAYIGIGVLFLLGAWCADFRRSSLLAVAVLFGGFAAGRLVSILVDGVPVALYLVVLAFELVCALFAIRALLRSS
ncbi:MAG TPA: DUF4345 domain-containing protein [Beijerinckiaceae bacterium]|nr:DUF4345 domain-containing protein [Beijerinckiaceae bacterium]